MDGTLHLYICSNCSTSVQKKFSKCTEFIDRFKVEKLESHAKVRVIVKAIAIT